MRAKHQAGSWRLVYATQCRNYGLLLTLRVAERFDNLLLPKRLILNSSLVIADTLNHQPLVLLRKAFRPHRRVWHIEEHKDPPEY